MIYIPSYKRPKDCKAAKWLKSAVICCHEFEWKEYRKNNENEVMIIPDGLAGKGMARIRNWIMENAEGDEVTMVDDGVVKIQYFEGAEEGNYGEGENYRFTMTEGDVLDFVKMGFVMCRELGTVLWGVNVVDARRAYREYSPFSLKSVVLGPFFNVVKNQLAFDERLGLKEDFDYCVQVLDRYRRILRFNKYHYVVQHLQGKGGCRAYRTAAKEGKQLGLMQRKWGSKIVGKVKGKTDPRIRVPIAGI